VRIFGPCKSARIAIVFFIATAALRSSEIFLAVFLVRPVEKFSRATFIPASSNFLIMRGELLAGPMVQTILE